MKVALYQNFPEFGQVEKNIDVILNEIRDKSFDLLVLPELFATGYQFKDKTEAKSFADNAGDGYTFQTIQKLSEEKDALIIYGYPELSNGRLYNSSLAVKPDGKFHNYQKVHLFDSEKGLYEAGKTGFFVFSFKNVKIGMMVCYDWRFPESARKLALDGAQIICHPSNLIMPHCPQAMITRALENNVFTVTANRIGFEDRLGVRLDFIGKSRIIAPNGIILAKLSGDETGYIDSEINPELAKNKRITAQNDIFEDRREEFY
jgi:predicted amidohydrolase